MAQFMIMWYDEEFMGIYEGETAKDAIKACMEANAEWITREVGEDTESTDYEVIAYEVVATAKETVRYVTKKETTFTLL